VQSHSQATIYSFCEVTAFQHLFLSPHLWEHLCQWPTTIHLGWPQRSTWSNGLLWIVRLLIYVAVISSYAGMFQLILGFFLLHCFPCIKVFFPWVHWPCTLN